MNGAAEAQRQAERIERADDTARTSWRGSAVAAGRGFYALILYKMNLLPS